MGRLALFLDPNHVRHIQQFEQRKKDPRLILRVNVVVESENRLARWLAEDGAQNMTRPVLFRRLFVIVYELWMLDMGLGPIRGDFQALSENEMMEEDEIMGANVVEISDEGSSGNEAAVENDVEDGGDDVQMVLFGAN